MPLTLQEKLEAKYAPTEQNIKNPPFLIRRVSGEEYIPLDMSMITEDDEKRSTSLSEILMMDSPYKTLFEGVPGIGKSTTLTQILELYDRKRFDHVLQIKLDLLLNSKWKDDYEKINLRHYPLACLAHASLEQIIHGRGGINAHYIKLKEIIELFEQDDQSKTLLIVDGFDKIAHLIGEKYIKGFITQILEFDNVFMSTRPRTMVDFIKDLFDNIVTINGINGEKIKLFIKKYFIAQSNFLKSEVERLFNDEQLVIRNVEELLFSLKSKYNPASSEASRQLEKILGEHLELTDTGEVNRRIEEYYISKTDTILNLEKTNHAIHELLSNPMHATMICMQDIVSETLTLAELYRGVINRLGERFIPMEEVIREEPIETLKELQILKKLAYKSLANGDLSWQDINEELGDESNIDQLLRVGILQSITSSTTLQRNTYHSERDFGRISESFDSRTFKFIDRSILEYLAACEFKDRLMLEKGSPLAKEAAEFIASHRHETKYLTFLKFTAGEITKLDNNSQDEVPIALIRFWEAVECVIHETVETAIDKPIILWMNLLSQVMINKQPDPRIPNLSKIIDIIDTAIINDFIRWKTVIVSSGYLSPKIQEFLEQQITSLHFRANGILDDSGSDDEDNLTNKATTYTTEKQKKPSDISEVILDIHDYDRNSEASHISSIISVDMTSVEYAIETYGSLYNLVENNRMFDLLFPNFCAQDDKRITKYIIIAIARIIKNHHITEDRIYKFKNKLEEYNNDEYLSSSIHKALLIINAESEGLSSTNLRRESTVIETGSETLLSQQRTPFERPPLEHSDTNLKRLLSSSLKDLSSSLKINKSTDTIQVLINNLLTNPYWLEERWEIRMEALLEILGISNDEVESSINPTLKRLSIITNKALQAHIYLVNDNSNLEWFYNNFKYLKSLVKIGFDSIIDAFTYQIFSDNYITPQESRFICLCITAEQLSITIKPPKSVNGEPQYIIVYNGREYILHGFYNAKQVEKIIETAIENKAEVPVLKNTGSGIRIAASNLPCYSMVDGSELSSEEALITWCYRTSHLLSEPTGVFILLERKSKYFGQYVVTKISVKDDGSLRVYPDYYRHPNDINSSFRVSVFGAMIYTDNYKIRYRTDSVSTDQKTANDILITAKRYSTDEHLEHSDILSKRTSRSLKHTEKLSQERILSINDKIKILHSLIKNIDGIKTTGDWSQDLTLECKLIEHDKNIIDAVDAQHTDSFRIKLNEHSAAIESFEKFTEDLNLEALTKIISSEEAKEHAREEMIAIEANIYKLTVYEEVVLKINAFYIAVNAIYSEMIKSDSHGAAGRIGSLLGKLGPHVPLLGPVVEFMGEIFTEIDGVIASERIENFVHFALTGGEMAEISDKLARKILHYDLNNIQPSARTIITQASSTITNLVDNGPTKIIVQACKKFKDHLEEHFIDEEEQEENELKSLGKKHAEIITKAIIESIFTKSYDPKIKVGTIMKGAAITAAKVVKNDNEFKASSIIKLMVEKYDLHKLDTQTSEEHRDSLNEENEDEHTRDPDLIPAGYDAPSPSRGIGCGSGKCIIMAITDSIFDDPQIKTAFNQEDPVAIISALQGIHNKARIESKVSETDSDKIISLYADAQRLYSKDAMTQIYEFTKNNEEEAAQLLLIASIMGNKYVLKEMFGASNEDNIKDFKNIVAAEYEEGSNTGGISQYIHNACFGENSILSTARNLIKYITNMYSEFQELLFNEEYGDRFLVLQDQLQLLLTYAEKGQPAMPLGRPYRGGPGDDNDYNGGGGGSSGLFFEGNNEDSDNNFIDTIPHYSPSLNETKFRKLLIEIKAPEEQDYSS